MGNQSLDNTAGLGGFLAFFLLALALYFLMRNMNARLRRMAYREEQEARATGDGSHHDDSPDPPEALPDSAGPKGSPQG